MRKGIVLLLSFVIVSIFTSAFEAVAQNIPAVMLRQPETIVSLVYSETPKRISVNPTSVQIGQSIECQTWIIRANNVRTRELWIQISGNIEWGINRGEDCPADTMVRGYSDGKVQFISKSNQTYDGDILLVVGLGKVSVEVTQPSSADIRAVFDDYGEIVPLVSSTLQQNFACEVTISPAIPLISLYTTEDHWALYEAWEISSMGWVRVDMDYLANPYLQAPPENFYREIDKIQELPISKNAVTWGSIKTKTQ